MVSSDFVTDTHSSIVDSTAGLSLTPKFHKLISWYGACPRPPTPCPQAGARCCKQHAVDFVSWSRAVMGIAFALMEIEHNRQRSCCLR